MTIALILASMGIMVAIPYVAVAMRNRRHAREAAGKRGAVAASVRVPMRAGKDRIRWVDTKELARSIVSDPELVIFRLVDGASGGIESAGMGQASRLPGRLAVTLKELEETLP